MLGVVLSDEYDFEDIVCDLAVVTFEEDLQSNELEVPFIVVLTQLFALSQ